MPDLPSEPSLQQLRHQARDLQRAVRRGDQDALAEVAGRHPAGRPDGAAAAQFPLSAAQLVVARRYDFTSWVRLRRYVEVVERYSRFPERMTAGGPENPADEFLRLACLYLIEHGAPAPDLGPGQRFVAAALVADRAAVDELRAAQPGLAEDVRRDRPALIVWAAARGRPGSAELLAGLGFDVNARGRSDVPAADPWQTALHVAAMDGRLDLARSLLRLGADPDIRDQRFDSTPLGWARHFAQEELVALLEPLTAPEEA